MSLPLHEYILYASLAVALALLIVRLGLSGLVRTYKFFFLYVLVDFIQTSAVLFLPFRSSLYVYFFMGTEGLTILLYAAIVFELYRVLFRGLPGVAEMARRYTLIALGVSIFLALLLRLSLPKPRRMIEQFFYFEIPVVITLVAFILLLMLFLAYYPVPVHRNGLVYAAGYSVYFLTKSAILFLSNAGASSWIRACSTAASIVAIVCILFWTVMLRREWEHRTWVTGTRRADPLAQRKILEQLRELNESLMRARAR